LNQSAGEKIAVNATAIAVHDRLMKTPSRVTPRLASSVDRSHLQGEFRENRVRNSDVGM